MIAQDSIGSAPSERVLNDILIQLSDPKLTNKALHIYQDTKECLVKLRRYVLPNDIALFNRMAQLLRDRQLRAVDGLQDAFPKELYTHLRCCVVGLFRQASREMEETRRVWKEFKKANTTNRQARRAHLQRNKETT